MGKAIYAAALSAKFGQHQNNARGVTFIANNMLEAHGKAIQMANGSFPRSDGWYSHEASIVEVPADWYEMKEKTDA